jgi:hypothetical protein
MHAVLFPLLGQKIAGVDKGVMCNVHHPAARMSEDLAKGAKLFHGAWIFIAEQIKEHFLRGEEQFLRGFEVTAGQEQSPLEGWAGTFGQQNFQVDPIKAKHHKTRGQGHLVVWFFLWKVDHFSHVAKVEEPSDVGNGE